MAVESLVKGKEYKLIPDKKYVVWPERTVVYVRREHLPKIGGDWETFYSIWGGTYISGSEPAIIDGIILRLRVKPEDLVVGKNRIWGRNIFTSLMVDDEHVPLVQDWLKEVEGIMSNYRNREILSI